MVRQPQFDRYSLAARVCLALGVLGCALFVGAWYLMPDGTITKEPQLWVSRIHSGPAIAAERPF